MDNNIFIIGALLVIMVLIIVCFVLNIVNSSKINALYDYAEDGDLTGELRSYYDKLDALAQTISDNSNPEVMKRISECEARINGGLSKIGVTNFDAYDDVSGNLSFSVALLNANDDGIIITSLYGHNSCNTYIREIKGGNSGIYLLEEEKSALERAIVG